MTKPRILMNISNALRKARLGNKTPSNQPIKGQKSLIKMLQAMDYPGDDEGICRGITQFWVDALISGREEKFIEQVRLIDDAYQAIERLTKEKMKQIKLDITDDAYKAIELLTKEKMKQKNLDITDDKLFADNFKINLNEKLFADNFKIILNKMLSTAQQKIKNGSSLNELSKDDQGLLEMQTIFENMELHQNANRYNHVFGKRVNTEDIESVSLLTASPELEEQGGLIRFFSERRILPTPIKKDPEDPENPKDYSELQQYFDSLKEILEVNPNEIAITLNHPNHIFGLHYLGNNMWRVVEPSYLPFADIKADNIGKVMVELLKVRGNPDIAFNLSIYTTRARKSSGTLNKMEEKLNDFHKEQNKINPNIVELNKNNHAILAILAAISGNVEELKALHENAANNLDQATNNLDQANSNGTTPLIAAVQRGRMNIVETLLNFKVDVNKPTNNNFFPLHFAALNGHAEMINTLFAAGADINCKDEDSTTPLRLAASQGHVEAVKALISNGAKLNQKDKDGMTALHYAASQGHVEAVKTLISNGADLEQKNKDGMTALHFAASQGHVEAVKTLISNGANLNSKDNDGMTALHYAAKNEQVKTVEALIAVDADLEQKNKDGMTALHFAAQKGNSEIIKTLINKKATIINQESKEGLTAAQFALLNGQWTAAVILLLATKEHKDIPMTTFKLKNIEKSFRTYLKTLDPKQRSEVVHGVINNENALGSILKLSLPKSLYMQMRFVAGRKDEGIKLKAAVNDTFQFAKSKLKH